MWVASLVQHLDIVQLKVEELVHALECALDREVVLQLDRDCLPGERLERREHQLLLADETCHGRCVVSCRVEACRPMSGDGGGEATWK